MGFSLVAASRGYCLFSVASLVAEHGLWGVQTSAVVTPELYRRLTGSIVVVHGLNCFTACGIFLDQGLNPHLLHWQVDSLSLNHQGSPGTILIPTRLDEKTWPLMVSWCRVGDFCKEMIWWGFVSGGEIYVISSTFILPLHHEAPVCDRFQLLG